MAIFRDNDSSARSLRPQSSDAVRASLLVGDQVADATLQIQQKGGLLSVFGNKEMKRLRDASETLALEQAAILVEGRAILARDTGLQAIDLEKKQRLTEIAHAQTATTAELQKQAHSAGARAICRTVAQENSLQQEIQASRCSPQDKELLSQFTNQLAAERIRSIYQEQLAPFGKNDAPLPRHSSKSDTAESEASGSTDNSYQADEPESET